MPGFGLDEGDDGYQAFVEDDMKSRGRMTPEQYKVLTDIQAVIEHMDDVGMEAHFKTESNGITNTHGYLAIHTWRKMKLDYLLGIADINGVIMISRSTYNKREAAKKRL